MSDKTEVCDFHNWVGPTDVHYNEEIGLHQKRQCIDCNLFSLEPIELKLK